MVNGSDPTRRRHLRVLKLKASRGKLPIDPAVVCGVDATITTTTTTTTSVTSSTTTVAITPSSLSSSSPTPLSASSKDLTTSEQKKQARQIRNRQAAITSRQRYLADTELLKQRVAKLESENKSLLDYIAKLHHEKMTPPVNFVEFKLPKPDIFCSQEHATFYLRGISPIVPSHCREINLQ
jgi:hypothetical protein